MSHTRDYSEEIASTIDEEVRRLIESAHDEAWEILVQYREVLDDLVLNLIDKETLSREQVLQIFAPIKTRPSRGSYTGYGKRLPSDQPPVLTPKELALTAATDVKDLASPGNGSGSASSYGSPTAELPALGGADEGGGESR
jgi:cell division protease FtsH